MARLFIATFQSQGHLMPIFAAAKRWAAAGHEITVSGFGPASALARQHGLSSVPLFPDVCPENARDYDTGLLDRRRQVVRTREILRRLSAGDLRVLLRRFAPHVCLVDSAVNLLSLSAFAERLPVIHLHTDLPFDGPQADGDVAAPGVTRVRAELRGWRATLEAKWLLPWHTVDSAIWNYVEAVGYPRDAIDRAAHPFHRLRGIPEFVLCPRELETERTLDPRRTYLGPVIDHERPEPAFDLDLLDPTKRLIYCSISEIAIRDPLQSIAIKLASAVSRRSDLQLVMALGRCSHRVMRAWRPSRSVVIVRSAPQLAMLKRAAAFVTHAGMGSIKESIMHGVPMLTCPMTATYARHAEVVTRLGLGTRISADMSVDEIDAHLSKIVSDPSCRERVTALSRAWQRYAQQCDDLAAIDHWSAAGGERFWRGAFAGLTNAPGKVPV